MLEQYNSIRQGTSTVEKYMVRFDDLRIQCDVQEDPELTLARFEQGLRAKIHREMVTYTIETLEVAFQHACEIEHYHKIESRHPIPMTSARRPVDPVVRSSHPRPANSLPPSLLLMVDKGKFVVVMDKKNECFKCHNPRHLAANCPNRTLYAREGSSIPKELEYQEDYQDHSLGEQTNSDDELKLDETQPTIAIVHYILVQPQPIED